MLCVPYGDFLKMCACVVVESPCLSNGHIEEADREIYFNEGE